MLPVNPTNMRWDHVCSQWEVQWEDLGPKMNKRRLHRTRKTSQPKRLIRGYPPWHRGMLLFDVGSWPSTACQRKSKRKEATQWPQSVPSLGWGPAAASGGWRSFRSIQRLMAGEARGGLGGAVGFWNCPPSTSPSICFLMSRRGQEEAPKPKSTLHISEIMVIWEQQNTRHLRKMASQTPCCT